MLLLIKKKYVLVKDCKIKVVELTGAPCSGKTKLIDQLCSNYNAVPLNNNWLDEELRLWMLPPSLRLIFREIILLILGTKVLGISRIFILCGSIRVSGWNTARKLNVLRNVLAKFAMHKIVYSQAKVNFIIDEGISHIPFIFATSLVQCPTRICTFFPKGSPIILRINCEPKELRRRLMFRGHDMLHAGTSIDKFIELNVKAGEHQKKVLENILQFENIQNNERAN